MAGLGAAAVAGIGTKAYLDKKENSEQENEDELEIESWEDTDDYDIEYLGEDSDERDYLNPTDEYAYQEEPIEPYEATNSSSNPNMV